jgi:hypothetical protein
MARIATSIIGEASELALPELSAARLDAHDTRFDQIDGRFDQIDAQLTEVLARLPQRPE